MDPVLEEVTQQLECPLCRSVVDNPKLLSCHHSFCERCLEDLVASLGRLECPICLTETPLVHGLGVRGLPTDFFRTSLLGTFHSMQHQAGLAEVPEGYGVDDGEVELLLAIDRRDTGATRDHAVYTSTADLTKLRTKGAVLATFIEGKGPDSGSLGAVIKAYDEATGKRLVSALQEELRDVVGEQEGLKKGMLFGRVNVEICPVFSSLWVAQLPKGFDQDDLSAFYNTLKKMMPKMMHDTQGSGSLVMPLIGVNPSYNIMAGDVVEEVVSLMVYCAGMVPQLSYVTLVVQPDNLNVLKHELWSDRYRDRHPGEGVATGRLRELLPSRLEVHIGALRRLLAERLDVVDGVMQESLAIILTQFDLCQVVALHTTKPVLVTTICMQARRVLERYCRLLSGNMHLKVDYAAISDLVERRVMPTDVAIEARKIVRNGNKAVHTTVEGISFNECDSNLSLFCVIVIINHMIMARTPLAGLAPATGPVKLTLAAHTPPAESARAAATKEYARGKAAKEETAEDIAAGPSSRASPLVSPRTKQEPESSNTFTPVAAGRGRRDRANSSSTYGGVEVRLGDWFCEKCGNHNFASRTVCNMCGAPKTAKSSGVTSISGDEFRPGDWNCQRCNSHNFASRTECRGCGVNRPAGSGARGSDEFKPGDWNCTRCGSHNFASRAECRNCGVDRAQGERKGGEAAVSSDGGAPPTSGGSTSKDEFKPGDWNCPRCGNHNFASRIECRGCGASRAGGAGMGGSAAGDWTCPSCTSHNFARRTKCRSCGRRRQQS